MPCLKGYNNDLEYSYYSRPCYSEIPCYCWSCERGDCKGCKKGCVAGRDKGLIGEGSLSLATVAAVSICDGDS